MPFELFDFESGYFGSVEDEEEYRQEAQVKPKPKQRCICGKIGVVKCLKIKCVAMLCGSSFCQMEHNERGHFSKWE